MNSFLATFILPSLFWGMFVFTPMPEKPDFTKVADYVQGRYDHGHAFPRQISKEKFIEALVQGTFDSSDPQVAYKNKDYPYDSTMARYFGVVTLSDGTLFTWKIPRQGIIEIADSQYRTGYLFYPKELLDLSSR